MYLRHYTKERDYSDKKLMNINQYNKILQTLGISHIIEVPHPPLFLWWWCPFFPSSVSNEFVINLPCQAYHYCIFQQMLEQMLEIFCPFLTQCCKHRAKLTRQMQCLQVWRGPFHKFTVSTHFCNNFAFCIISQE